jgi:hypothetical protein
MSEIDFNINTSNMDYFNSIKDKLYFCEYDHINLIDLCSSCLNNKIVVLNANTKNHIMQNMVI